MNINRPDYDILDHTADLGIKIFAATLSALFVSAGMALFDLITPIVKRTDKNHLSIAVSGEDEVDLLINWLRELLYLFNGKELIVNSIAISSFENWRIKAQVGVIPFDADVFEIGYEIKAVTYHQARIERTAAGYLAEVIFDL